MIFWNICYPIISVRDLLTCKIVGFDIQSPENVSIKGDTSYGLKKNKKQQNLKTNENQKKKIKK